MFLSNNDLDNDDDDNTQPLTVIMKRIQSENHTGYHPPWELFNGLWKGFHFFKI